MQSYEGFTVAEKRQMCLSAETLEGLRMTGFSLIYHGTITPFHLSCHNFSLHLQSMLLLKWQDLF